MHPRAYAIVLMTNPTYRSGKSSVQKVIFEKFSPAETLFLDPTTKIETARMEYEYRPYCKYTHTY